MVGSDSGRIVILEYQSAKNVFEKVSISLPSSGGHSLCVMEGDYDPLQVHQETFGKSGCRRIVPGQYLAVDPKGRAAMIGEWA